VEIIVVVKNNLLNYARKMKLLLKNTKTKITTWPGEANAE